MSESLRELGPFYWNMATDERFSQVCEQALLDPLPELEVDEPTNWDIARVLVRSGFRGEVDAGAGIAVVCTDSGIRAHGF